MANTEAKTIQVSSNGSQYYTLPGSSGEISIEGADLDNTIFGSEFSSSLTGVFDWSFSGNAWLRETPGFQARVKRAGTPTSFTSEVMVQEEGDTYRIQDYSKSLWDHREGVTISDGGATVDPEDILSIDHLFGRVTFANGYQPTGEVTATGRYLGSAAFGCANSVSLTQNAEAVDQSCFETVQEENGFNIYGPGLKTVSMEMSGFYRQSNNFFQTLKEREDIVIEIDWEGDGQTISRGVFKLTSTSQSGDAGGNEDFSASFGLSAPEDVVPFSWYFGPSSKTTQGMRVILNSWVNRTNMHVRYFPNGVQNMGYTGETVVTDCSLSTSVDGIGELTLEGQGTGELTIVNG